MQKTNDENTALRAWNRQLDDTLFDEINATQTSDQPKTEKSKDHNKPQSSTLGNKYLKDINTETTPEEKKRGSSDHNFGGEPPGLASLRGNGNDDAAFVSASISTAADQPRVSRREADKVFVSLWPKH